MFEPSFRDQVIGVPQILPARCAENTCRDRRIKPGCRVDGGQLALQCIDAAQIHHRHHAIVLEVDLVLVLARPDRRKPA